MSAVERRVGIEALNVYGGVARIAAAALFEGRGLDAGRFGNLMMRERAVGLPFEDPVTNAANAARPVVDGLDEDERARIEIVLTCSESGIDYSKSIASYVHEHLGLGRHCRLLEVKQACYSATAALQLAVGYVASGLSPGAKVLIVATDVSLVDAGSEYAEPATGTGAVAMLVGDRPSVMAVDLGAFGSYSFETMDTARPTPDADVVDVDRSLLAYHECLVQSFQDYQRRVEGADILTTFDYLAMHTPFAGMVRAGHRKLLRELNGAEARLVDDDFERRVAPSLVYPGVVGNLFSGSLYLALSSVIENAPIAAGARVGLFSYGSGCSSEFFSGLVDGASSAALAAMRIDQRLRSRRELTFEEYLELLPQSVRCLVPERNRRIEGGRWEDMARRAAGGSPMLVLRAIADYHRQYEWI